METRKLLAAIAWDGGGDGVNWTNGGNWSTDAVPGPADDVTLSVAANPSIIIGSGIQSINSLSCDELLTVSGSTTALQVATTASLTNKLTVAHGKLQGGTYNDAGGGSVAIPSGGTLAGGVTLNAGLTTTTTAGVGTTILTITGGLTLNGTISMEGNSSLDTLLYFIGTQTLGGSGSIVFGGNGFNTVQPSSSGDTLTIGPNITIRTGTAGGTVGNASPGRGVINLGTISAQTAGKTLSLISGGGFTNSGTITASAGTLSISNLRNNSTISANAGATLTLGGTLSNTGSISATGGTTNLNGTFTQTGLGTFTRSGGTVNLGGTLTGGLMLNAATGSWNFNQGTISGGTVTATGGTQLFLQGGKSGTLAGGITLNSDLVAGGVGSTTILTITGGLALNGTISMNADADTILNFAGSQTLGGSGSIVFGGNGFNTVWPSSSGDTLTIGPNITIRTGTAGGTVGNASPGRGVINLGTISAQTAGKTLSLISGGGFTNSGTITASVGTLAASNLLNQGVVRADGGSISFPTSTSINTLGLLQTSVSDAVTLAGSLTGTTTNADQFRPRGSLTISGGSSGTPRLIEAMSADRGGTSSGYSRNFAHGVLALGSGAFVRLQDAADNAEGAGGEAIYAAMVSVPLGSTLDLNGLNFYTRSHAIAGTVLNGSVQLLADGGALAYEQPTPGALAASGEADDWTFFGRSGRAVTVTANPGSGLPVPAPFTPRLNWVRLQLLDASDNVLADVASTVAGATATLSNVVMPADGTYRVRVKAASSQPAATGNYVLTAYDSTVDVSDLTMEAPLSGRIETPHSTDRWNFAAAAGQQVRLRVLSGSTSSTTGIAFTLSGPGGYTGFSDITTDSALITLPASGAYSLSVRTTGVARGAYSFKMEQTVQAVIPLGGTYNGTLAGKGHAQLFKITVPLMTGLLIRMDDSTNSDQIELYARFGLPPTRELYDQGSGAAGADKSMAIPSALAGDWYVLVYGQNVPVPSAFTLEVQASDVLVAGATPEISAVDADLNLSVSGAGFHAGTAVWLVDGANVARPADSVSVDLYTQLTATFAAGTLPEGTYALRVSSGGQTDTFSDAVTIAPTGAPRLETSITVPSGFGRHAPGTVYVNYANTGNVAMAAPLLVLESGDADGSDQPLLTLDHAALVSGYWVSKGTSILPDGFAHEVSMLASGATAGVLQPGESISVPVYYAGLQQPWNFSDAQVEFQLRVLQPTEAAPIDWNGMKAALRPFWIDAQAWEPIYSNVQAQVGTTWGDYVRALADNAAYLGRLGQNVTNIAQLFQFELLQAQGLNPISHLAADVDASMPTPGLPLLFNRTYGQSLIERQKLGAFGRGWSGAAQTTLQADADGSVTIYRGATLTRRFQKDSRGGYFALPGDTGKLVALGGGAYKVTETTGGITAFRPDGKLDYEQDTNANRLTYGYDANGRLATITHSAGQALTLTYNPAGLVATVTDSAGRATLYGYDPSNEHLVSVTAPDGKVTTYTYSTGNGAGSPKEHALTSIALPGGLHRFFTYDAFGRLTGISKDGGAEPVTFAYDSAGTVSITEQANASSKVFFDSRGLRVKTQDALGNATVFTYSPDYHLTKITNAAGLTQSFAYCDCGALESNMDELGHVTRIENDGPFKLPSELTDANGNETRYAYDAKGNLLATVYANGSQESMTYDPLGNALSFTNRRGQATSYTYNAAGQVTKATYFDGTHDDFTYDSHGNLETSTDAAGTTTFTYDNGDRLASVTYPTTRALTFTYDDAGRRSKMVDQSGFTVNYLYDPQGRLSQLTDGADASIVSYAYDAAGRLSRQDNANGTYSTHEYDLAGQLLHLVNHAPDASVNSRFDYTYDALGRRKTMATVDGAWAYTYDATGQLTRAVLASTNPAVQDQDLTYVYDAMGNRVQATEDGITTNYVVNNMNQYTSVGGIPYTYDADGNLLSDGSNAYTYDTRNRLASVIAGANSSAYEYDALGQRTASIANGQRSEYLVDPTGLANVVGEYSGAGSLIANNVHGLGLVSRVIGASRYFFDFDASASTAGMSDAAGTYVNRYSYLPFGEMLAATATVDNSFQFVGELGVMAEENGLHFMRARYYATPTGRFTSPDPLGLGGGQVNLYSYAANSPLHFVDPAGLCLSEKEKAALVRSKWEEAELYNRLIDRNRAETERLYAEAVPKKLTRAQRASYNKRIDILLAARKGMIDRLVKLGREYDDAKEEEVCPPKKPAPPKPPKPTPGAGGGKGGAGAATATDPNDKFGPAGFGPEHWVARGAPVPYKIRFENYGPGSVEHDGSPAPQERWATAPAQLVNVIDDLPPELDWSTFRLKEIGFGDLVITIPGNSQSYVGRTSMTYGGHTFDVELRAGIDLSTGRVFASFSSVDPVTGLPPDVLSGFLPPEDGTGRGQGFFSFTVVPRQDLATGTEIRNVALISFDGQTLIATNQVDPLVPTAGTDPEREAPVTIDAAAPSSSVSALPATTVPTSFTVTWSGADDIGGSGIATFDIYVSDNGGEFISWLASTTQTSATYDGTAGHTYAFYSIAGDGTGHAEPAPAAADASIEVIGWYTASSGAVFAFDGPAGARNLTVTSGTVTFLADALEFEPDLNIQVAAGAQLILQTGQHINGISVGGEVVLAAGNDKVLVTQSLFVGGQGRLNLTDNALVVLDAAKSPIGSWDGSAYTGVTGLIQSAYNFGAWDGAGIMTSMPDAGSNVGTTTLAVATGQQILFIEPDETGIFKAETVTGASIIVKYTYAGDVNVDGLIDGADYGTLDNWIQFPGTSGYANGDVNYDGVIDGADYGTLDNSIQLQGDPL